MVQKKIKPGEKQPVPPANYLASAGALRTQEKHERRLCIKMAGKTVVLCLKKAVLMVSSMFKRHFCSIDKRTRHKNDHSQATVKRF